MKEIRESIKKSLIKRFDCLLYPSIDYVNNNKTTYRRISFDEISDKHSPFRIDFDSCIKFILDSKSDIKDLQLTYKTYDNRRWSGNEINYPFISRTAKWPSFGTNDFTQYRLWRNNIEYECEGEFWSIPDKKYKYELFFERTNIFDNKIVKTENEAQKYSMKFHFNKDVWLHFISALIEMYLPQFSYSTDFSDKKTKRYLKEIKKGIWFGYEYQSSEIIYQLKQETPSLPEYFNLILLTDRFKKNTDLSDYYYKPHSEIISLGILGNPFFYPPCYPLEGYVSIDRYKKYDEGVPYTNTIIKHSEGYQIINSVEYGETIKKHAFFYIDLLADTANIYLKYLNEVLNNAL